MKYFLFFLPALLLTACGADAVEEVAEQRARYVPDEVSEVQRHYDKYSDASGESISTGTVGNGSLKNGRIVPFTGENFHYFDTVSYLKNRGFVHEKVLNALLASYTRLSETLPEIQFGLMECSRENGGRIRPHFTHQNGLSVDFMSPLCRNGKQCLDYDFQGAPHYLMAFDADGNYSADKTVSIDFETMAVHLLTLAEEAKKSGLAIEKVILKLDLKDNLFATPSGKKLRASGIYFATNLTPLVNALHDDHYHVDFKKGS